jgi:hypothetical protein
MGEVHETVFGGNFAPQRKVAPLPYAAASILTAWHGAHERVLYEGLCEMETLLIEGSSTEFSEGHAPQGGRTPNLRFRALLKDKGTRRIELAGT